MLSLGGEPRFYSRVLHFYMLRKSPPLYSQTETGGRPVGVPAARSARQGRPVAGLRLSHDPLGLSDT